MNVYEGNKTQTKDCHLLGTFKILGLQPAPRGQIQIPVVFNIDVNGILTVQAGNVQLPISKGRLTIEEIEKMVTDASDFAESDEIMRNALVARNKLENYLVKVQRALESAQRGVLAQVDEQAVSLKCIEVCRWLNEGARNGIEYERKLKELKSEVDPHLSVVRRADPSIDDN